MKIRTPAGEVFEASIRDYFSRSLRTSSGGLLGPDTVSDLVLVEASMSELDFLHRKGFLDIAHTEHRPWSYDPPSLVGGLKVSDGAASVFAIARRSNGEVLKLYRIQGQAEAITTMLTDEDLFAIDALAAINSAEDPTTLRRFVRDLGGGDDNEWGMMADGTVHGVSHEVREVLKVALVRLAELLAATPDPPDKPFFC